MSPDRHLFTVVGLALANVEPVSANDAIRSGGGHIDFILHTGKKPVSIQGTGLQYLDPVRNFNCKSVKGCIVSVQGTFQFSGVNGYPGLCGFVDGNPTFPACANFYSGFEQSTGLLNFLGSGRVTQGIHTIQSAVSDTVAGGQIDYWEMQYTIYER
jgi:hypothetical protein